MKFHISLSMPIGLLTCAIASVLILAVSGCITAPISANPVNDILTTPKAVVAAKVVVDDLVAASGNLDSAVKVGALAATDPAPACLHGVMVEAGIGKPVGPSFTPTVSGLVSLGSILYIRARQAQGLAGQGIAVPIDCKALIGSLIIDAARAGVHVLPSGGLLPVLR